LVVTKPHISYHLKVSDLFITRCEGRLRMMFGEAGGGVRSLHLAPPGPPAP